MQFIAAATHPTYNSSRISNYQSIIRNIFRNNSACADKGITANGITTNNGCIGPDGSAAFYQCTVVKVRSSLREFTSWIQNIGKNHRRAAENIIFQFDAFVDGYIILNFDKIPDFYIVANVYILTNRTFFTNTRVTLNMAIMPDFSAFAN